MASGAFTLYSVNKNAFNISEIIASGAVKIALLTSAYTPNASNTGHSVWSDVSANEILSGNGYTTGGVALTNLAQASYLLDGYSFTTDSASWLASGGSIPNWRYAVMYVNNTAYWGKNKPLIGYFLGDTTPQDIPATAVGTNLVIQTPTNGWFTVE